MITYRPPSWSAQARSFADEIYRSGKWMVANGEYNEKQRSKRMIEIFQDSWRNKTIIYRAAKRAHRKGYI